MGLLFDEASQAWVDLGNLSPVTCITRPWTCTRGFTRDYTPKEIVHSACSVSHSKTAWHAQPQAQGW